MTELITLPTTVGETTEVTVVTGPASNWLVSDWIKLGCVEVVVQVEAGCVIVTGNAVVTTPVDVLGVGLDTVCIVE